VKSIHTDAPTIVFWRVWLAQPVMLALAYATGGGLSVALLRKAFLTGSALALSLIFSFLSITQTSVANATLIPALQPALVLVIAHRMFGERRTRSEMLYAAVAFAGIVVVVLGASSEGASGAGDLFAVCNLLVFTAYFMLAKNARDAEVHSWSFIAAVFLVTAVVCTPWCLVASDGLGTVSGTDWLWLVLAVLGPGVLGHGLITWAHRYLDVGLTSLMALGNPAVATIAAWLILGEALTATQVVAAAAVLVALDGIVQRQRADRALAAEAAASGDLLDG
jgi:drug/metabolite transporter (DMT)-like permease